MRAWELVKDWTAEERQALRDAVPRTALATPFRNRTVLDIARDALAISAEGLRRRRRLNGDEADESIYLDELEATAESGRTPAEILLGEYETVWHRDIDEVFRRHAY